ncbi:hypothetical protein BKA62DRAFT_677892 [Auriculariales sp. MPI-PUGE-AT-0066]|nr:hypothetical protein BKA62DRAFT_677892 [Auriculariales sp. MPI-PUGE-AT-0066]
MDGFAQPTSSVTPRTPKRAKASVARSVVHAMDARSTSTQIVQFNATTTVLEVSAHQISDDSNTDDDDADDLVVPCDFCAIERAQSQLGELKKLVCETCAKIMDRPNHARACEFCAEDLQPGERHEIWKITCGPCATREQTARRHSVEDTVGAAFQMDMERVRHLLSQSAVHDREQGILATLESSRRARTRLEAEVVQLQKRVGELESVKLERARLARENKRLTAALKDLRTHGILIRAAVSSATGRLAELTAAADEMRDERRVGGGAILMDGTCASAASA